MNETSNIGTVGYGSAFSFRDLRVVLTGGSTGIGRATALALASRGAKILIVGRDQQTLQDALDSFVSAGVGEHISAISADTSKEEDLLRIFEEADRVLNGLDVLINNAAVAYQGIMDGSYDDWLYVVKTNLLGYMACTRYAADRMKAAGKGHIVNVGSMSADVREEGSSVYVATKAGIQGFSEALRKELNPLGIKVSLIEPGAVSTNMQPASGEEKEARIASEEMLREEDIADAILYTLAQPARTEVVSLQIRPHAQLI
jgi:short-subunit dehydrogenase